MFIFSFSSSRAEHTGLFDGIMTSWEKVHHGFKILTRSPEEINRVKSSSRVIHVHPCSRATAACCASETIFPVALDSSQRLRVSAQCLTLGIRKRQLEAERKLSTTAMACAKGVAPPGKELCVTIRTNATAEKLDKANGSRLLIKLSIHWR